MSIIAALWADLLGSATTVFADLTTDEKLAANALTAFSLVIAGGATITADAGAALENDIPALKTAIAGATAKVVGWETALKTALANAAAWVAAREVDTSAAFVASAEEGKPPVFDPRKVVIS